MKKILISFNLALAFATAAVCQPLKRVKLDSVVSVNMPADYHKLDTLGQQSYTANAQYGYIIVNRSPNPARNKTLKKEKDLNSIFKEYIRKIQASLSDGHVINDHDTVINNLEVRDFTLQTDTGSGVQLRRFRILYTKPVTYSFQYLYDEIRKDVAAQEMNEFFKSITVASAVNGTDQFTNFGQHKGINKIWWIAIAVLAVIVVIAVLIIRKRRRSDILINDVLK